MHRKLQLIGAIFGVLMAMAVNLGSREQVSQTQTTWAPNVTAQTTTMTTTDKWLMLWPFAR
jgi:hypothetical protein